jgi:hypothetical protein
MSTYELSSSSSSIIKDIEIIWHKNRVGKGGGGGEFLTTSDNDMILPFFPVSSASQDCNNRQRQHPSADDGERAVAVWDWGLAPTHRLLAQEQSCTRRERK